jgi:hypothetical protein
MSAGTPHMFAGSSPGLSAELSAGTSGSQVRFVSTGTHSWSRTNRTDKFFPMGVRLSASGGNSRSIWSRTARIVGLEPIRVSMAPHRPCAGTEASEWSSR